VPIFSKTYLFEFFSDFQETLVISCRMMRNVSNSLLWTKAGLNVSIRPYFAAVLLTVIKL